MGAGDVLACVMISSSRVNRFPVVWLRLEEFLQPQPHNGQSSTRAFIQSLLLWKSATAVPG